jgi:hypothetical protein
MLLDGLAHLDLLRVALLRVELGPQAAQVLRILALLVALAGGLLARALLVVETLAVELGVPFWRRVLVRHFRRGRSGTL